jgi:hypothetical protein
MRANFLLHHSAARLTASEGAFAAELPWSRLYGGILAVVTTPFLLVVALAFVPPPPPHVLAALIPFGGGVVCLTYVTIATLLNSTVLRISRQGLTLTRGPLPWFRDLDLQRSQIQELILRAHGVGLAGSTECSLRAKLADGTSRTVAHRLDELTGERILRESERLWLPGVAA